MFSPDIGSQIVPGPDAAREYVVDWFENIEKNDALGYTVRYEQNDVSYITYLSTHLKPVLYYDEAVRWHVNFRDGIMREVSNSDASRHIVRALFNTKYLRFMMPMFNFARAQILMDDVYIQDGKGIDLYRLQEEYNLIDKLIILSNSQTISLVAHSLTPLVLGRHHPKLVEAVRVVHSPQKAIEELFSELP